MLNEVFEAIFGVDFKAGRTVRDIVLHPIRVGEAELEPGNEHYTPQMRIFIALFGLQVVLLSVFTIYDVMSLERLLPDPQGLALVDARLGALGSSRAEADAAMRDWYNYSLWPAAILGSLVYIAAMKALRPAMRLSAHVKLYLLCTNAAFLWALLLMMVALIPGIDPVAATFAASIASMAILIGYFVIVFARWYASSSIGLIFKTGLLVALIIPSMIITLTVSYSLISFGMKRETGLGLFEAIGLAIQADTEPAQTAPTPTGEP